MSDDLRTSAEIDDSADDPEDWTVLPPEVDTEGDVDDDLLEAVEAAVDDEPNTLDAPRLRTPESVGREDGHAVAFLVCRFNEIPTSDGQWLPPYRAREDFRAALREHLPDGYQFEDVNNGLTGFYES